MKRTIDSREEFGHWDIDVVIGENFNKAFKSIISNNGAEFANFSSFEKR